MTKQQTKQTAQHGSSSLDMTLSAPLWMKRLCEGGFILLFTIAAFLLLALVTYQTRDPGWFHAGQANLDVVNGGGRVGAYTADFLYAVLGYAAYTLPAAILYVAGVMLHDHKRLGRVSQPMLLLRGVGLVLVLFGGCGLLVFWVGGKTALLHQPGGLLGHNIAMFFHHVLNPNGALLLLCATFLVGITWLTGLSWVRLTEVLGRYTWVALRSGLQGLKNIVSLMRQECRRFVSLLKRAFAAGIALKKARASSASVTSHTTHISRPKPTVFNKPKKERKSESMQILRQNVVESVRSDTSVASPATSPMPLPSVNKNMTGTLPSLELLAASKANQADVPGYSHEVLESLSNELEQHLLDFGIQATVVAAHPGPVITRFELQLAAGIKVSKLSALAKDLARSLSVTSVRVVEIIPGKTVVGLELPNPHRAMVVLSEVLSSDVYQQAPSSLTLALGVDIAGHPMVVDLAKMPHLLVAGTTGSGKSVGINAMILSLLLKSTPEQVRLILIDPKMLELSVYDGIPHLLTPVVTDMKEAASALRWCVEEMERRYRLMAALGVRNLAGFNSKIEEARTEGTPLTDPLWKPVQSMDETAPLLSTLPYVVVVIDELADMMMVVGKKVEQLIARIAQKARAAGIHLILATQRPSVDVLTGLIKSNIPTRISFQVSSKIDSRTILDQQGAEQLLGHGDMLFLAPGTGAPLRVHGAFVDDQEVHRVADDWRARGVPEYIDAITDELEDMSDSATGGNVEDVDALYDEAVAFVMQTRKASTSSVQRRFKIGYNRAARLIDEMERVGLVGPLEGGMRDVLVSSSTGDAS
jgi:DNA segregation ATPase FtsK/SpoIIIE, S-DNA-T family